MNPAPGKGILYLVPMPLARVPLGEALPPSTVQVVSRLGRFIAENARTARRFLSGTALAAPLQEIPIDELNEHTTEAELGRLLAPLQQGQDVGLVSEAGCPVVADPGAALVHLAHAEGIRVVPLVGPTAPILALMASGLGGQSFRFGGYLPQDAGERRAAIVSAEREARSRRCTQIFIETPYRNLALLEALLETCSPDTLLTLAADLTAPTEWIATRSVAAWRPMPRPPLDQRPAIFLIGAAAPASAPARPRRRRP